MKRLPVCALALAALVAAAPAARAGVPRPMLDLEAGHTFATHGDPGGGGMSLAITPMWDMFDHARFGLTLFADDIGTDVIHLIDVNDGSDLGAVATTHRWAWGAAWRGEADVLRRGNWTTSASGEWGWWRIEDDHRGVNSAAASAIGLTVGADVRHTVLGGNAVGLALRYHRPFTDHTTNFKRLDQYASAAIEWRWDTRTER